MGEDDAAQRGQGEVGERADQRDDHHVVAGAAEPVGVDRNRLGPPVGPDAGQAEQGRDQQGADRVDVANGIEIQSPGALGRVVAEGEGDDAVGDLVEDDRGDQDDEIDQLVRLILPERTSRAMMATATATAIHMSGVPG